MTTEYGTNEQLHASTILARKNLARLAAQKANPPALPPLHREDGGRRQGKRAAVPPPKTRLEREAMDARRAMREAGLTAAAPLTNSLGEAWPGKPPEECESLFDVLFDSDNKP